MIDNVPFQKIPAFSPKGESLKILKGWKVSKGKTCKGNYEAKIDFLEGGGEGGGNKKPSVGEGIFLNDRM